MRNRKFWSVNFRRQVPLGSFILDFYCAELALAIEIDGPIHRGQLDADRLRQRAIEELGVRFVRVSAQEVEENLALVLGTIRAGIEHPSTAHGRGTGGEGR